MPSLPRHYLTAPSQTKPRMTLRRRPSWHQAPCPAMVRQCCPLSVPAHGNQNYHQLHDQRRVRSAGSS